MKIFDEGFKEENPKVVRYQCLKGGFSYHLVERDSFFFVSLSFLFCEKMTFYDVMMFSFSVYPILYPN